MRAEPNRIAATAGLVAVVFNILGALFLSEVAEPYRPGVIDRWYFSALQHESAVQWSAWSFSVASTLTVAWVAGMAQSIGPYAWPGAGLIGMASTVSAAASLLPFVVVTHLPHGETALGETLLGLALTGDAVFHLGLGTGLILFNLAMARAVHFPMWLSGWGLVAGILCFAVVGQAWSTVSADFVYVAGPFWQLWFTVASVVLFRLPAFNPRDVRQGGRRRSDVVEPSSGHVDPFLAQSAK